MPAPTSPPPPERPAPGFERRLLRRLPGVLAYGALAAAIPSLFTRVLAWTGLDPDATTRITAADIFGLSTLLLVGTAIVLLATGAVIVVVMKGPAHFADSYPLDDAERPD